MVIDLFLRQKAIGYMRLVKGDEGFGNRREDGGDKERVYVGDQHMGNPMA